MSVVQDFFDDIRAVFKTGEASEHSYRPALKTLFDALSPDDLAAVNEPRRTEVGAPDFSFLRDGVPVGHCEAKDIGLGLTTLKGYSIEQKKRYTKAFPNLLYTNGLEFEFIFEGERRALVNIGDALLGDLQPREEVFAELEHLLRDFFTERPRTIHSSKKLAEMMAGKAALIKDVMGRALLADRKDKADTPLVEQYEAFREHLIHDIQPADFADLYAETIAYGLFAARLHDDTLDTFSRTEALELLPKSNPFLRSLFSYIAGPDLDDRIAWVIDELAKIFLACDLKSIMADFGKLTGQQDPFLHFYETFLAAYNPAKRKAKGVWYTPEPVVNFIVRAVDEVLKTEFGLADGLADTSKIKIDWDTGQKAMTKDGKRIRKSGETAKETREVHRVQILDPATGTGTFLAEVIKQIAPRIQDIAPGMWSKYIEDDLIPRLHGFELLMASYAMCHMKLDMILTKLGYKPTGTPPRLSVYLTNSLEEGEPADQTLPFAQWLSREAKGANTIKRDMPIMCVIGNPPYLGEGGVSEGWLGQLMDDYKKEPGGIEKLKERNPKWINDLYVKFIRMSSHLIEKNGEGVLGFITNHGYLDNPTFRGMRWRLMKDFDRIWILDLHGNAKKKEVSPDGRPDKNVFDIQQGVAIIIAVKTGKGGGGLAEVMQGDLWGARADKYEALTGCGLASPNFASIRPEGPNYPLQPVNQELRTTFEAGFNLKEFAPQHAIGIITKRDGVVLSSNREKVESLVQDLALLSVDEVRAKRPEIHDTAGWSLSRAKENIIACGTKEKIKPVLNFPFDVKYTYHSDRSLGFLARPVYPTMRHFYNDNIGLMFTRITKDAFSVFVTKFMATHKSASRYDGTYIAPLYLYPAEDELDQARRINFDPKLHAKLRKLATHPEFGEPGEVAVFDYIYGVLHSPDYRETFAEFLKIDFPRIPWPATPDVFWSVREKGEALRRLHLMEDTAVGETPYPFLGDGDPVLEARHPDFKATKDGLGDVWINKSQRFTNVPEIAWGFPIGGYQPAQKWLKDRKGRTLGFDDIRHYQKIIKILAETDRIMKEIKLPLDLPEPS
ncbi:adenine specific DNA methyltransferase [Maricaulis maris MCS10]|uniref:site-specific DNA-methyltransferase (adenine-specific) n=1 Tax=Maricaulis maris (strain MCS10) TaxID=394221 RepID=Q0ASV4_MARMM|nr:type ISP restriction/modification enzyme [Maricaulis maris]ABI64633.1 adenine specific DNA methyltransferase [Maricaulis maris MCS10]